MSKKPETVFGEKVDKDLKKFFGKDIFIENIQQTAKSGTPDRLICCHGHFIGLELKESKGKVSAIQHLKLSKISVAGGSSLVAYPENWPEVFEYIKRLFGN